ncbi:MAG TPA: ABC-2 family transporter protein [Actinomycetes bacterium]
MADTVGSPYAAVIRSRVRAQTSYRFSFTLDVLGAVVLGLVDLAEIYVIFHQVDALGGFSFGEVALMYGLAGSAFSIADLAVGHIDRLPTYVRSGQLDSMLLRPLSALGQLLSSDVSLRRLGRASTAAATLAVALLVVDVDWTPSRVALLVITPVAGTVIFSSVFVATSSITFWLVESTEFTAAFTYGGNYLATWPTSIFTTPVRRLFTFVIPAAFVAYLPVLAILGRPDPAGLPSWLSWCGLPVAGLAALGAGVAWRAGLRHYVGAGS